jgi:hypothetical protein
MNDTDELLEQARARAESYLEGRAKVTAELVDYGMGARLWIERDGRHIVIIIRGEQCGPGFYNAGVFTWDPNDTALEKLLGYLMQEEGMRACVCGHSEEEHKRSFLQPCEVEGCDCIAFEEDSEEE